MGQRFTIDAEIMQCLVHSSVEQRMLPDVLDVPAALGSDVALQLLTEYGICGLSGQYELLAGSFCAG